MAEGLIAHGIGTDAERRTKAADLLAEVGLAPDAAIRTSFPAASASASGLRVRSRSIRNSSWPMNASRRWMC